MKIIQLSDIHISKKNLYGISPNERFKKAIQHVLDKHSDSDYLVISGDLTDTGDVDSYNELKNILTSLPDHLSPHLLIGNHDERENFRTVFDSTKTDDNGYIQYVINSSVGNLIMLDTNLRVTDETIKGKFSVINPKWNYTDKLLKTTIEST